MIIERLLHERAHWHRTILALDAFDDVNNDALSQVGTRSRRRSV
jgi:hypothetical protein